MMATADLSGQEPARAARESPFRPVRAEALASIDDGAAQLAMAVETIADEVDDLARRLVELRAEIARQRVRIDALKGSGR